MLYTFYQYADKNSIYSSDKNMLPHWGNFLHLGCSLSPEANIFFRKVPKEIYYFLSWPKAFNRKGSNFVKLINIFRNVRKFWLFQIHNFLITLTIHWTKSIKIVKMYLFTFKIPMATSRMHLRELSTKPFGNVEFIRWINELWLNGVSEE